MCFVIRMARVIRSSFSRGTVECVIGELNFWELCVHFVDRFANFQTTPKMLILLMLSTANY